MDFLCFMDYVVLLNFRVKFCYCYLWWFDRGVWMLNRDSDWARMARDATELWVGGCKSTSWGNTVSGSKSPQLAERTCSHQPCYLTTSVPNSQAVCPS